MENSTKTRLIENINGQSFLYFGRNYRLKIVEEADGNVHFSKGFFTLNAGLRVSKKIELEYSNSKDMDGDEIILLLSAIDTPVKVSSLKLKSEMNESFDQRYVTSIMQQVNEVENVYGKEVHQKSINELRPLIMLAPNPNKLSTLLFLQAPYSE